MQHNLHFKDSIVIWHFLPNSKLYRLNEKAKIRMIMFHPTLYTSKLK